MIKDWFSATTPMAPGPPQPQGRRWRLVLEITLVVVFVLVHIWEPAEWTFGAAYRNFTRGPAIVVIAVCLVGSMWRLRESRAQLGLTRDSFRGGWRSMAVFTAISLFFVVASGFWLGDPMRMAERTTWLAKYVPTMMFQQLVLQWFFCNRLYYLARGGEARRRNRAALGAAGIFVLLHAPNAALMIGVAWAGWFWCRHFREHRNLAAVMTSHAILGVASMAMLGQSAMLNLRVGWPAVVYLRARGYWPW